MKVVVKDRDSKIVQVGRGKFMEVDLAVAAPKSSKIKTKCSDFNNTFEFILI